MTSYKRRVQVTLILETEQAMSNLTAGNLRLIVGKDEDSINVSVEDIEVVTDRTRLDAKKSEPRWRRRQRG